MTKEDIIIGRHYKDNTDDMILKAHHNCSGKGIFGFEIVDMGIFNKVYRYAASRTDWGVGSVIEILITDSFEEAPEYSYIKNLKKVLED